MAKFPKEFIVEARAKQLGLEVERLTEQMTAEFYQAIDDLANVTYANIVAKAQAELNSTRQDYLKGLKFDKIGAHSYLISMEGKYPNELEEGYPSFDMKPGMLASKKVVTEGSRAGLPWVQTNKKGGKFAHVPFEHSPYSKAPKSADMADAIRSLSAYNRSGRKQKITSIFKDDLGRPLSGKVASVKETGIKNLDGITKFQKVTQKDDGKFKVESLYMTWRTIGENSQGWKHPGFKGLHAFDEAEKWVEAQIDEIIKAFKG